MSSSIKPVLGSQLELGHPLATGLVGLWLMNEGSGGKVFDLSGNNNDGTFVADTFWTAGKFGSALSFDGTGDYVDTGITGIDPRNSYTIVFWINWRALDANQTIGCRNGGGDRFYIGIDTTRAFFGAGGTFKSAVAHGMSAGVWYQVALVIDGTNALYYVNGILKDSFTYVGAAAITNSFHIGDMGGSAGNETNGLISHTLLYNRALTVSEIALLSIKPFIMFERDPIELWVGSIGVVAAGIVVLRRRREGY